LSGGLVRSMHPSSRVAGMERGHLKLSKEANESREIAGSLAADMR